MTDYQKRTVEYAVLETGGGECFALDFPLGTKRNPGTVINAVGALLDEWIIARGECGGYAVSIGYEGNPLLVETPEQVIEVVNSYTRAVIWSGTSFRVFVS